MIKLRLSSTASFRALLRFFRTAPMFPGIGATGLSVWGGTEAIARRWRPNILAITHLLALGFMTMIMIGALIQVFPVVLGGGRARLDGTSPRWCTRHWSPGAALLAPVFLLPGRA